MTGNKLREGGRERKREREREGGREMNELKTVSKMNSRLLVVWEPG